MMMARPIPIASPTHIIIFMSPVPVPVPEVDFPSTVVLPDTVETAELPTVPMMVVVTRKPTLLLLLQKCCVFFSPELIVELVVSITGQLMSILQLVSLQVARISEGLHLLEIAHVPFEYKV